MGLKVVKACTKQAMHDHTGCIFDRSAVGMSHWNVNV